MPTYSSLGILYLTSRSHIDVSRAVGRGEGMVFALGVHMLEQGWL